MVLASMCLPMRSALAKRLLRCATMIDADAGISFSSMCGGPLLSLNN